MHPLTILAVGLYGEVLPNQNGAPLRSQSTRGSAPPQTSTATERRLPSLFKNTKTLPFNGYGEQVASMLRGPLTYAVALTALLAFRVVVWTRGDTAMRKITGRI